MNSKEIEWYCSMIRCSCNYCVKKNCLSNGFDKTRWSCPWNSGQNWKQNPAWWWWGGGLEGGSSGGGRVGGPLGGRGRVGGWGAGLGSRGCCRGGRDGGPRGGVSRCHSIDWLPKLWLIHFFICRSASKGANTKQNYDQHGSILKSNKNYERLSSELELPETKTWKLQSSIVIATIRAFGWYFSLIAIFEVFTIALTFIRPTLLEWVQVWNSIVCQCSFWK